MNLWIIIVFLVLLVGFLLARLLVYKKDLRSLLRDLDFINNKKLLNSKLVASSQAKEIEDLVQGLNQVLGDKQALRLDYMKMEKRNKEMIASVSHDLRTPLTSIKGYVDLLDSRIEDEKSKKYIAIIQSRTQALSSLITTFYDLSKLEASGDKLKLEYVDLEEVLVNLLADYYDSFQEKRLSPRLSIEPGNYQVLGDRHSIERVFTNLLDNGLRYATSQFEISLGQKDGFTFTRFTNDSRDLDQDHMARLFDKFYIVDTARQSESTGLGLFITRQILEYMGYSIGARLLDEKIEIEILWN